MRKNPYDIILKGEFKEQHINTVLKSYSFKKVLKPLLQKYKKLSKPQGVVGLIVLKAL